MNGADLKASFSTPQVQETISIEKQDRTSYHELCNRIKRLNAEKRLRYPSSSVKRAICPRLRKSFSSKESLVNFFSTMASFDSLGRPVRSQNTKKLLLRQFFYALRVGEVCASSYNQYTRLVRIETEKMGRIQIDYIPFIEGTESLFECANVSKDCLRNLFRRHLHKLGKEYPDVYHRDKNGHDLHRLTTHSLRVMASNLFREHTGQEFKQKVFLRHSIERAYGATAAYMEYPEEDFRKDLNACFSSLVKELVR